MSNFEDARQYAPATERNRQFILDILLEVLPKAGNILEIASGTGEHAVFFAPHFTPRQWIPSETSSLLIESIKAWSKHHPCDSLHSPLEINAQDSVWAIETMDIPIKAIVNINMIHISPWSTCEGLMRGGQRILPSEGRLYLYGPFKREGKHTAPSNEAFDQMLQSQNTEWGVRNLEDVVAIASDYKLNLVEVIPMPANNLSVIFQKQE